MTREQLIELRWLLKQYLENGSNADEVWELVPEIDEEINQREN